MITNEAFLLNNEELARYNNWAENIATGMVEAEVESWTLNVTFSFCNLGTDIIAQCGKANLVIRNGTGVLE